MFFGEYQHSLDAKGRVIIPSKHREELGEKFMMTRGLDKCIYVYPMSEWDNMVESVRKVPLTDKRGREFVRFFFSNASECEPDKQGRVVVANNLKTYAGLDREITILGVYNRLEIWDKETLEQHDAESNDPDSFVEELADKYGI